MHLAHMISRSKTHANRGRRICRGRRGAGSSDEGGRSARRGRDSECAACAACPLSVPARSFRAARYVQASILAVSRKDQELIVHADAEPLGKGQAGRAPAAVGEGCSAAPKGANSIAAETGALPVGSPRSTPPSIREASATAIAVHWVRDGCHQPRPHFRRGATLRIPLLSAGAATAWQGQRTGLRRPRDRHQRRSASEGTSRCTRRMAGGAEIGHLRAQRCDGPRAAPGHGLKDLHSPSELGVAPDPTCDPVV